MLSRAFIERLNRPPIAKATLAKLAGVDRFWLSRLIHFTRAIEERDVRLVRLGRLLGLSPSQIFTTSEAEIERALQRATRSTLGEGVQGTDGAPGDVMNEANPTQFDPTLFGSARLPRSVERERGLR